MYVLPYWLLYSICIWYLNIWKSVANSAAVVVAVIVMTTIFNPFHIELGEPSMYSFNTCILSIYYTFHTILDEEEPIDTAGNP